MNQNISVGLKIAIVGQGYVGLPLAFEAIKAGHSVTGVDLNKDRVEELNAGYSAIDDICRPQV